MLVACRLAGLSALEAVLCRGQRAPAISPRGEGGVTYGERTPVRANVLRDALDGRNGSTRWRASGRCLGGCGWRAASAHATTGLFSEKGHLMGQFRTLYPQPDEVRTWGRCLSAFEGATASGMFESDLEPSVNGGLSASIPLLGAEHMRMLWEAAKLDRTDPQSGWFRIGEFGAFDLLLTGYKFKTGFFSPARWLTNVGFLFQRDRSLQTMFDHLFYEKVGAAVTRTIAEVCPLLDRVKVGEWLFVDQNRALSSVGVRL
jgi:hypothetical protein